MPRTVVVAVTALSLVGAGCAGDDATHDWASPCTEVEPAEPRSMVGTIAYAVQRRAGSELAVADLTTSKTRRLTKQRTRHDSVGSIAWSRNGRRIAYSGGKGGWNDSAYDDIWVVSRKGGSPRRLTHSYEDDWDPAWSPDGRRLAFDRQSDGWNWIYVINADGTGLRRLTKNFNWHPVWTPDGHISYINAGGIWVMDANGGNKRLLARADVSIGGYAGETPMAWSPDGELIAYTTGTALWVMRADGTARRKIFGDPNRNTGSPVWSPDGLRIVWDQGDGDLEIYVANRDGKGVRNVTSNERVTDEAPTWASDGRSIAFLRTCGNRSVGLRYALLLVSPDGGEAAKLPDSLDSVPVWAP